jgi:hypothetical protein
VRTSYIAPSIRYNLWHIWLLLSQIIRNTYKKVKICYFKIHTNKSALSFYIAHKITFFEA